LTCQRFPGICEIIGTFLGLLLILYTKRKWLYTSVFNIVASFISLAVHLIPPNGKTRRRCHGNPNSPPNLLRRLV
jgi:hypothetical protein